MRIRLPLIVAALGVVAATDGAAAQPVADFYREKGITLVIGSDASGEYNQAGRLLARHIGKHIPGNPVVTVQNMPGASGIKSANYLYSVAPKDGSVFGLFNKSMPYYEATKMENTRYKSVEFNWIGSMVRTNNLVVVWAKSGVKTLEDAKRREVVMGSIGAGGTMTTYPVILNHVAGTKFKLVLGYAGGQVVDLAMERGEVDGRGSYSWSDLKKYRAEWIADKKINVLAQYGMRKEADLPDVPLSVDLGRDGNERRAMEFISADVDMAKPFMFPPNVPKDRVAALRAAFAETMTDLEFLGDAKVAKVDVSPISGAELEALVRRTIETPPELVAIAERWMTREER
ncbi:MAG: Bug family tripartite tricarboxylate transporter substrate binding protein [Gemmatimonas sp.]